MTTDVSTPGQPASGETTPGNHHLARAARSGGLSVAGAVVSAFSGVALTALITHGLDKHAAGTVFATTALFMIVTNVVLLGADVGLVRFLPLTLSQGRTRDVPSVLRAACRPVLAASVVVGVLGYVFAAQVADWISSGSVSHTQVLEVRAIAVFVPVSAVYTLCLAASRGLGTMIPTVSIDSLGRWAGQLASVGVVQLFAVGAFGVVVAWSVPYALALAVALGWLWALLRRRVGDESRGFLRRRDGSREVSRDFWRFASPRAVGIAAQVALKRSDIILVAALRSPKEAALYAAASRFVVFGQLGVQALQQSLSPQLAGLFGRGDHARVQELYRATTAWSMMLAWPVYLGTAVMAPDLLALFGDGYSEVASVAVLLSIAMLAATASGAVDAVLLMSGRSGLSLANNLFALIANVGMNIVLIPRYGALGAGISWAICIIVRNALPLAQVATMYRISPLGREAIVIGTTALASLGVLPAALRIAGTSSVVVLAAYLVGLVVFLAVIWRLRAPLQLDAFTSVLRRRRVRSGS